MNLLANRMLGSSRSFVQLFRLCSRPGQHSTRSSALGHVETWRCVRRDGDLYLATVAAASAHSSQAGSNVHTSSVRSCAAAQAPRRAPLLSSRGCLYRAQVLTK